MHAEIIAILIAVCIISSFASGYSFGKAEGLKTNRIRFSPLNREIKGSDLSGLIRSKK